MSGRPEEALRQGGTEGSVASIARDVLELLEILWHQGEAVSTAPLSSSQVRVLYVLERGGVMNLRTLAAELDSMPPSVSRMCDRLHAVGFIERTHSPSDRRALELRLSRRGASYLESLRARREEVLQQLLDKMTTAERTMLMRGLVGVQAMTRGVASGRTEPGALASESA
ncbi:MULTISPECIES: MarR family transcriptional regulator [unclassified Streptomyces]|uniref:MarR family transcriptional regulator n=1 Tax=unclassified Streptomyces TaxID=2593676 RepID=UPI0036E650E6